MLLDFNGWKIHVNIEEERSFVSKHSGASLGILKVQTTVRGKSSNDDFLSLINQAKTDGVASVDQKGEVQKRWSIGNTSWSHTGGSPIYRHALELTEVEQLNLTSLVIGDLTVQPYEYGETIQDDELAIEAKVSVSEEQHRQIKAMQRGGEDFPVVRYGINETPKQMRFGLCYWSEHDAEYKYQLSLLGMKKEPKPSPLASAFRWIRPLRNQVADNTATIDSLLATLRNKNILTGDEVASIREDIAEQSWDIWYGFFRVENVEDL